MSELKKNCFGKYDKDCCYRCNVAVECYEERNDRLMDKLAMT